MLIVSGSTISPDKKKSSDIEAYLSCYFSTDLVDDSHDRSCFVDTDSLDSQRDSQVLALASGFVSVSCNGGSMTPMALEV